MAFNLAVFKTRTLTAAVFVVVMLIGVLGNNWSFFLLFSIIHFGSWVEYQKLVTQIDPGYSKISTAHRYGTMTAGWLLMLHFFSNTIERWEFGPNNIGWWWSLIFFAAILIIDYFYDKQRHPKNPGHSMFGYIYLSLPLALLIDLGSILSTKTTVSSAITGLVTVTFERLIPIMLIGSIWINDTMAYVVGSLIGKTPFSKISPKKTWEGTIGGAVLCIVVMGLVGYGVGYYSVIHWVMIAAIAAIAGTAGDLFESKLKRMAGVKDSGSFMPGHGGFLDRFDSLLVATPFVWLYVVLVMR